MKNLLLLFSLVLLIGCGEKKIESQWSDRNFIVDGSSKDWENFPLVYDEDLRLLYGIANNDTCLYLMVRFSDRRIFHQLSRLGFTVWFNENNEKQETLGIHYINEFENNFSNETVRNLPQEITHSGTFTLSERDSITGGINIKNVRGLQAAASYEDGSHCFELSISLNETEKMIQSLSISSDGKIKLCLEIGNLGETEMVQRSQDRKSGVRRGGRGGGNGRRQGKPLENFTKNLENKKIWLTLKLNSKS
ncbi:MAG: hypothetical protein DWQ06_09030 [Calditrichaeota bacterium]|nr:MAG: hypothetical protein DWQ06_09030 [Calditrichota bacterium]